jgi:putative transposase
MKMRPRRGRTTAEIYRIATISSNTILVTALASGKKNMKRTGTYSKIYLQVIFAVKYRECLLDSSWEESLYKYITGIIQNKEQLLLAINGHRDHIHILVSVRPACRVSDLVREIKKSSTEFINLNRFVKGKFYWQEGYGVFSYSRWDVDMIIAYIRNQKEHHQKKSFRQEYMEFLKEFEIEYQEEYLFDWIDEEVSVAA